MGWVDPGTVRLTVMGPPDMPPALANGAISGYIVADPFNAVAEVNDVGKILLEAVAPEAWARWAAAGVVVAITAAGYRGVHRTARLARWGVVIVLVSLDLAISIPGGSARCPRTTGR